MIILLAIIRELTLVTVLFKCDDVEHGTDMAFWRIILFTFTCLFVGEYCITLFCLCFFFVCVSLSNIYLSLFELSHFR